jgi:hypothetical protein
MLALLSISEMFQNLCIWEQQYETNEVQDDITKITHSVSADCYSVRKTVITCNQLCGRYKIFLKNITGYLLTT